MSQFALWVLIVVGFGVALWGGEWLLAGLIRWWNRRKRGRLEW